MSFTSSALRYSSAQWPESSCTKRKDARVIRWMAWRTANHLVERREAAGGCARATQVDVVTVVHFLAHEIRIADEHTGIRRAASV